MLNIKAKITEAGFTITQVAEELSKVYESKYTMHNLSKKIRTGTLRYSEVEQIAKIIGFEIIWLNPITHDIILKDEIDTEKLSRKQKAQLAVILRDLK